MNKKKIQKEISEHFASLGRKSWESRKKAILANKNKTQKKEVVK